MARSSYTGRFAPSPTGDLHFGSLVAAVGSFLQARFHQGRWLIRVEDLDPPREVAGSAAGIIADLASLGLESDSPVVYQSTRGDAYENALHTLLRAGDAFYCRCSRSQLREHENYPGNCRELELSAQDDDGTTNSARLLTHGLQLSFHDRLQGTIRHDFGQDGGDYVIRRGDGLIAYQLAVSVDDAWQGISEVVRGADLLDSTPRQILLFRRLGLPEPAYLHLPVITDARGEKLAKRRQDDPIRDLDGVDLIRLVLNALNHPPPAQITTLDGLWSWAQRHWHPDDLPDRTHIQLGNL